MPSRRTLILTFAPILIVGTSWLLTRMVRSPLPQAWHPNTVELVPVSNRASLPQGAGITTWSEDLQQACDERAEHWRERVGNELRIVTHAPFVLISDLPEQELENWYQWTIAPASRAIVAEYIANQPDQPISLFLFRGSAPYESYGESLFGDRHISVYGYYKPQDRAVMVNLATGSGTLVHELTHALMDFDFPDAPLWFQEGLASLHEQAGYDSSNGQRVLRGRINWRLAMLQDALAQGRLKPLPTLVSESGFSGEDEALDYAHARYFCLYLQQRGYLSTVYRQFRRDHQSDARGTRTLNGVLKVASLSDIESDFRKWCSDLEPFDR